MAGILNAEVAFPQFPALDQYGPNTTLLLHGDGTNGAQNNTFLDSSTNNFTITRNGNTTQGTFSPFSQPNGYWSNYLNGSSTIYFAAGTSLTLGTGDFTIEFWIYTDSFSSSSGRISWGSGGMGNYIDGNGKFTYTAHANFVILTATIACVLNQWNHISLCRSSGITTIYINGTSAGSASDTNNWGAGSGYLTVGGGTTTADFGKGYYSNVRIVKGSAVYTSNFTPSTTPLTAISGTSLLTCQSNIFKDNSSGSIPANIYGSPSVQAFKPFSAPTAYYPAVNGGAGYFDGSGDYLSVANNTAFDASSTWCAECWVYPTYTSGSDKVIFGNFGYGSPYAGWDFIAQSASGVIFRWAYPSYADSGTAFTIQTYAWNHLAVSISGGRLSVYANGVRVFTTTSNTSITAATGPTLIGYGNIPNSVYNGYISNARIVKGSTPYDPTQSTITVPTSPLTAITNTQLLSSFTNAGIIDSVSQNQLETVGNAQVSTTQSKFGGASMYFDGTGDYLDTQSNPQFYFGSGDFTIEGWLYWDSSKATIQIFVDFRPTSTNGAYPCLYLSSSGQIVYYVNSSAIITSPAIAASTWTYFALSRSSGVSRLFINGNQSGSSTDTTTYLQSRLRVANSGFNVSDGFEYKGYIDDLRITTGIARYTQNFTPPQNAFPNYGPLTNIPTVDPNFNNTTLLLHGNGTNGAQNNTFLDSSTNNFTITRNGNTTQGTFTPFSQPNGWWSNYFNGTTDYLSVASNAAFAIGANTNFTFEAWIYLTSAASSNVIYQTRVSGGLAVGFNSGALFVAHDAVSNVIAFTYTPPTNTWIHIAAVRNGTASSNTVLYINGSQVATGSDNTAYAQGAIYIGYNQQVPGWYFPGYISNIRLVNGSAVYTSNFTPSTLPLTAITNTSLLTCQSNYFKDNSTNAFAITANGGPSVQNFYPFFPPLDYSTTAISGSGYFDGSGDYLSVADSSALEVGSSNFTVEAWVYMTSANQANGSTIISKAASSSYSPFALAVYPGTNVLFAECSSSGSSWNLQISDTTAFPLNTWVHVALVRNSNTFTLYKNGVSVATGTLSGSLWDNTETLKVGWINYVSTYWPGYITDSRLVIGTAVYTSNFTPPTVPLTSITNTQFLCNFTNAGIFDNASKNDLETVGNAQISTTQSKFGGSSMYFDGSGDGLFMQNSQLLTFGTSDFTIEFWIYRVGNSTLQGVFDERTAVATEARPTIYITTGNSISYYTQGADRITYSLSQNTWVHIAVVKSSSVTSMYVNGISVGTYADTNNYLSPSNGAKIGYLVDGYSLNGYINDFRITNGVARYRYNFTPPAAPFPNK